MNSEIEVTPEALAEVLDHTWASRNAIARRLGRKVLTNKAVGMLDALAYAGVIERREFDLPGNSPIGYRVEYRRLSAED